MKSPYVYVATDGEERKRAIEQVQFTVRHVEQMVGDLVKAYDAGFGARDEAPT
jgi:hypothetical protein